MKRVAGIIVLVAVIGMLGMYASADDYVDDVYYSDEVELMRQLSSGDLQPQYDKRGMKEIIFLTDTTQAVPQDTIKAIIKR